MDENTTTSVQETEETPKDQYSIYNYLKENPASIVTVFSVLIAIVTFLAQVVTYMTNKKTLVYWGLDGSYATLGTDGLLYSAIASIVKIIVVTFAMLWYGQICNVYLENKLFYTSILHKCQSEKTEIKKLKKEKRKLRKTKHRDRQKNAELSRINDILNIKIDYRNKLKADLKCWKKYNTCPFLNNVIFIIVLMVCLSLFEMFLKDGNASFDRIVTFLILYSTVLLSLFIRQERSKPKVNQENQENRSNVQNQLIEKKADYLPFTLLRQWKGIPNSRIIYCCIPLCISLFSLVNPYTAENPKATTDKDSFQIVSIDDACYAVVYRENDLYFLEKAVVTDNTITIYTNEQRILTLEDVSFTVYTFKKENILKSESEVLP